MTTCMVLLIYVTMALGCAALGLSTIVLSPRGTNTQSKT
jgi:hypothetical protein